MRREELIRGDDLRFTSGLEIKHFNVSDILKITFRNYIAFTNYFILKPQDLIVELWGNGIYYEDIDDYGLFLFLVDQSQQFFLEMFKIFTNCDNVWLEYVKEANNRMICYSINKNKYYVTYSMFELIYSFFKEMRLHEHSEKRYFSGEKTKKLILDEDYEDYINNINSKNDNTLFSDMISFVVITNKRGWNEVYSYPIAMLYEEYIKTHRKERADHLVSAIYANTVDRKKIKDSDLEWFKT